jgi:dihydrofolate synthase/folylpolyglutamate synthase
MNYSECLDYLFQQLPMFQRVGAPAYKADLKNTIDLCLAFGNPETKFKSVHVAGTNGKGSVASALASIFQTCGYKTGLFTSPHLKDFRERIKINGELISKDAVIDFTEKVREKNFSFKPSFFEISAVMAFDYFSKENVDIAIIEVGMGGRLDSTNVILPELSVITSISKDHEQFLGNTLEKIATEKGGIIKPDIPVVVGENELSVVRTLEAIAQERKSPFYDVYAKSPFIPTDLPGSYQRENMRTVSKAVDVLVSVGWKLSRDCVEKGAMNVISNTGLRGRWEQIGAMPKIIADVGHNEAGVRQVVDHLRKESFVRLHIVWGMVGDKDAKAILSQLPTSASYYWCKPDIPRGKNEDELAQEALKYSLEGKAYKSVELALQAAKSEAMLNDLIFVGGSVFTVAEVLPDDIVEFT